MVADRRGQHTSARSLTGHRAALGDLARVPRKSRRESAKNGKGCEQRGIATSAREDKFRAERDGFFVAGQKFLAVRREVADG